MQGAGPSSGSPDAVANAAVGFASHMLPAAARRGSSSVRYDSKKAAIFVVNFASNAVEIYDPKVNDPSPSGSITNGVDSPTGDCLDKSGTLYVVDENTNSVPEYKERSDGAISDDYDRPKHSRILRDRPCR